MDLKFNSDGTVEGLATDTNREFLARLGDIIDFGSSKVKFLGEHLNELFYQVEDEIGHACHECCKKTYNFLLINAFDKETIYCRSCAYKLFKCDLETKQL